jgi:hypothetical protein
MSSKCTRIFVGVAGLSGISVLSPFLVLGVLPQPSGVLADCARYRVVQAQYPAFVQILGQTSWFSLARLEAISPA